MLYDSFNSVYIYSFEGVIAEKEELGPVENSVERRCSEWKYLLEELLSCCRQLKCALVNADRSLVVGSQLKCVLVRTERRLVIRRLVIRRHW